MAQQMTRVQLELAPQDHARLAGLKIETEAGSQADVVRTALRLYERLLGMQESGRLYYRDTSGELTRLEIF